MNIEGRSTVWLVTRFGEAVPKSNPKTAGFERSELHVRPGDPVMSYMFLERSLTLFVPIGADLAFTGSTSMNMLLSLTTLGP